MLGAKLEVRCYTIPNPNELFLKSRWSVLTTSIHACMCMCMHLGSGRQAGWGEFWGEGGNIDYHRGTLGGLLRASREAALP